MNKSATQTAQPSVKPLLPVSGSLQRNCDCGNHTVAGGECTECGKQKAMLQRKASDQSAPGSGFSLLNIPTIQRRLPIPGHKYGRGAVAPEEMKEMRSAPASPPAAPGLRFDFTRIPVTAPPIQRKPTLSSPGDWIGAQAFPLDREAAQRAHGERTPPVNSHHSGHPLPFLDTIQQSFGRYDVSQIRAHTDRRAAAEAQAIGAEAFTRGAEVTFSRTPSLHTAAHEAAHVTQQLAGVAVTGGMGQEGDAYERHADKVADHVVRGESSEDVLDAHPGAGGSQPEAVQGSVPAHEVAASRPPVIQMQRIPPNIQTLLMSASGGNAANFTADAQGAERLIARAMAELTPAEQATVMATRGGLMPGGLTDAQFNALPRRERLSRHADAIIALFPTRRLGDPNLIDTGPRPATADAANITKVVTHAEAIFTDIASGLRDTWLEQVFGVGSVVAAKAKYANARIWMNTLHTADKILTDRSGYADEVFQGGLTGFQDSIRVAPSVIDNPDDNESIVTLIHESMHAGNSDVKDDIYSGATGFETQQEPKKLVNSAHFEVVPWRILDPTDTRAYPLLPAIMFFGVPIVPATFQTFIPAGTGGTPARTDAEEGAVAAYELLNAAWALGLNLHLPYVQLFRTPTDWTVPQTAFGGMRFDNSLPFWSKVQKLTIHRKTTIVPASPDEAKHPVSQIDVALSEGLTRKLAFGMDVLDPLHTEAQILAFETTHSTAAERAAAFPGGAHTNANAERDFLLKLAVRDSTVAPMTGNVARDLRVVKQQGDPTLSLWSDILRPRNPASFRD
jgi:hypothetical protein